MIPNEMWCAQRALKMVLTLLTLGVMSNVTAESLDAAVAEQKNVDKAAAASQQQINETLDKTQDIAAKYVQVVAEKDSLDKYVKLLGEQVKSQQDEMGLIEKQLNDIETTNREVQPLMQKMVETLAEFVNLDVPFLLDERTKRVNNLKELMQRSDVTISEKYRRILEAYQIELEYGRTLEAYQGKVGEGDAAKTVELVRLGRIGLYYQTLDGLESGYWDATKKSWVAAPEYTDSIKEAIRVAKKEGAPDLLTVPVPAPQEVKS